MDENGKIVEYIVSTTGNSSIKVIADPTPGKKEKIESLPGVTKVYPFSANAGWSVMVDERYDVEFIRRKIEEILATPNASTDEAVEYYCACVEEEISEMLRYGWARLFDINEDGGVIFTTMFDNIGLETHLVARSLVVIRYHYNTGEKALLKDIARMDAKELASRFERQLPVEEELKQFFRYKQAFESWFYLAPYGSKYQVRFTLFEEDFEVACSHEGAFVQEKSIEYANLSGRTDEELIDLTRVHIYELLLGMLLESSKNLVSKIA